MSGWANTPPCYNEASCVHARRRGPPSASEWQRPALLRTWTEPHRDRGGGSQASRSDSIGIAWGGHDPPGALEHVCRGKHTPPARRGRRSPGSGRGRRGAPYRAPRNTLRDHKFCIWRAALCGSVSCEAPGRCCADVRSLSTPERKPPPCSSPSRYLEHVARREPASRPTASGDCGLRRDRRPRWRVRTIFVANAGRSLVCAPRRRRPTVDGCLKFSGEAVCAWAMFSNTFPSTSTRCRA